MTEERILGTRTGIGTGKGKGLGFEIPHLGRLHRNGVMSCMNGGGHGDVK